MSLLSLFHRRTPPTALRLGNTGHGGRGEPGTGFEDARHETLSVPNPITTAVALVLKDGTYPECDIQTCTGPGLVDMVRPWNLTGLTVCPDCAGELEAVHGYRHAYEGRKP